MGPGATYVIAGKLTGNDKLVKGGRAFTKIFNSATFAAVATFTGINLAKNPLSQEELMGLNDMPLTAKQEMQQAGMNQKVFIILMIGMLCGLIYQFALKKK